jgi:hypothetical protein
MTLRVAFGALPLAAAFAFFTACSDDDPKGGGAAGSGGMSAAGGSSGTSGSTGKGGTTANGGSGGGSGGAAPAADAFWASFAEALCHRYYYCVDPADQGPRTRLRAEAGSEDRCTELLLESVILRRSRVGALTRGVAAGALQIQQDRVATCLTAASLCNYPLDDPEAGEITLEDVRPCREVFEGTVPTGGDCDLSEECEGDSMCVIEAGATCTGTCAPRLGEGETCSTDLQCGSAPDQWPRCNTTQCTSYELGMPAPTGMSCTMFADRDLCGEDEFCPVSACVAPVALNEACDPADDYTSVCLDGSCVDSLCTAYVVRTQAGGSCADGELCDSFASLACSAGGCAAADGSAGSPCTDATWFERALCEPESLLANGAACTEGAACASGICTPDGCVATMCSAR